MDSMFANAKLPPNRELLRVLDAATSRLRHRILKAGLNGPAMDPVYRDRFYASKLRGLNSASGLRNSCYHLAWSLAAIRKPLQQIVFVDHGGGLGFNGLLAKEAGVGIVIYNDIDPKFLDGARNLARHVGLESDHYVLGDIDVLKKEMKARALLADALVSYDVLEHIYDNESFLTSLPQLLGKTGSVFMSSSANLFNAYIVANIMLTKHIPAVREYAIKRRVIIQDAGSKLTNAEVERLVRASRLLVRSQIQSMVEMYLKTGRITNRRPPGMNGFDPFRTNVVDPESGWWQEHFLNPFELARVLSSTGFRVRVMPGYYGSKGAFLNPFVRFLGCRLGLFLGQFYSIYGINTRDVT